MTHIYVLQRRQISAWWQCQGRKEWLSLEIKKKRKNIQVEKVQTGILEIVFLQVETYDNGITENAMNKGIAKKKKKLASMF